MDGILFHAIEPHLVGTTRGELIYLERASQGGEEPRDFIRASVSATAGTRGVPAGRRGWCGCRGNGVGSQDSDEGRDGGGDHVPSGLGCAPIARGAFCRLREPPSHRRLQAQAAALWRPRLRPQPRPAAAAGGPGGAARRRLDQPRSAAQGLPGPQERGGPTAPGYRHRARSAAAVGAWPFRGARHVGAVPSGQRLRACGERGRHRGRGSTAEAGGDGNRAGCGPGGADRHAGSPSAGSG